MPKKPSEQDAIAIQAYVVNMAEIAILNQDRTLSTHQMEDRIWVDRANISINLRSARDRRMAYRILERTPSLREYDEICSESGLSRIEPEALARGLPNSLYSICIERNDELVGMGRVIGDGGVFFIIVYVAVKMSHQRQGLGTAIVGRLLNFAIQHAIPSTFIEVRANKNSLQLYRNLGFREWGQNWSSMFYPHSSTEE